MSAVAKIAHIRNPLTIIAMFAVIAEVSGTVVLPMLAPAVQSIYVWFLMLFPSGLVALFFYTLHTKRDALYGPSDYNDEKNFMDLIRPASGAEVAYKSIQDIEQATVAEFEARQPDDPPALGAADSASSHPGSSGQASNLQGAATPNANQADSPDTWVSKAAIQLLKAKSGDLLAMSNVMLLRRRDREAAFAQLETLYGPIRRDMAIGGMVVDGLAGLNERPVVLETIHYSPMMAQSKVDKEVADLIKVAASLKQDKAQGVTALFVIIAEKRFDGLAKQLASRLLDPGRFPAAPEIKLDCFIYLVDDREQALPSLSTKQ
ncbi:hypothetical protein ACOTJD_09840 [Achromobacter xylosoxidans]